MHKVKNFSSIKTKNTISSHLIETQFNSYQWFVEKGMKELLAEISPIHDYSGKDLTLSFLDYYFDEPKHSEKKAKDHGISYEAPLRAKLQLENKKTGELKEQEIYLGDFPIMTKRGTFIVNGVERVIVSQIIRSPGVFFTMDYQKGKKHFGAKIIPNRGAWIEFETDSDNALLVRIDRKRKIAATTLLKVFGFVDNEEIQGAFDDNDLQRACIEATLAKDVSKTQDDGYIEIYKKIRPGDPAASENAKQLINTIFSNAKYDLSEVGRYKFNTRLYRHSSDVIRAKEPKQTERVLTKQDLILILKEIIALNADPSALADDVDHLGNRRIRSVGELLQSKLRVGLARMERIAKDRMSTLDIYTLAPAQLINARPLMAAVKEFFTSFQLSQFMDQINPLAELEHKRRISAMGPGGLTRERAGFEVRDVHPSHYGRICPIETPEGPNIGLVGHLASYAKVNKYGFIETPYKKVKNNKITDEIVYLNASEEELYTIATADIKTEDNGTIVSKQVNARIKGKPGSADAHDVDYVDVSPNQFVSIATSFIPFLEHDDANRALMGSNMQRQAVPCIRPEAPVVATGIERKAAHDSGQVVVAEEDGKIVEMDAEHIVIESGKNKERKTYSLHSFVRSNQYSSISQRVVAEKNSLVKKGDILADGSATSGGQMALGQNLLVAFLSFAGNNFEDAIILSERLVQDDRFTSIHIEDFSVDVRDTKLGPEITTYDIPNVGEDRLKDLDEDGVVRIGAEVDSGNILVGKISPKGEADLTSEERLLRAIFGEHAREVKDTSLRLPHGKRGRIVGVRVFSRDQGDKLPSGVIKSIRIEVAELRKISVGDKLAGRHGNKGVIAKILPVEDMPYLADGTPMDIILNPLGIASRMNIGQLMETHLGWAATVLGYQAITPVLASASEENIRTELKAAGLPETGKAYLHDGRTGERFDQPISVGVMYIMKLNHLVEDKIHMRSVGPYSLITQQPLGGKAQFGGQRLGEMEVWALEGYGAAYTLQEMLTIKSDDVLGRTAAYDSIIRGEKIKSPHIPASFHVLVNELKSLGLSVEFDKEEHAHDEEE